MKPAGHIYFLPKVTVYLLTYEIHSILARAPRHTRGQEKRKQVGRRPRVHQKEHGPYGRSRGGSRHVVHRSSGQGIFRVFRFQDALLSFQRSGGRVRVPGHQFLLYPRQRDCREVREYTAVGDRGCVYNLHRLDAHRERHGASDLPAARVLCPKARPGTRNGLR